MPDCGREGILAYFKDDLLYLDSLKKKINFWYDCQQLNEIDRLKFQKNCEGEWRDFSAFPTGTNINYGANIVCMDKLYGILNIVVGRRSGRKQIAVFFANGRVSSIHNINHFLATLFHQFFDFICGECSLIDLLTQLKSITDDNWLMLI